MGKPRNEASHLRAVQRVGGGAIIFACGYSVALLGPTWFNVGFLAIGMWLLLTKRLVVGYE